MYNGLPTVKKPLKNSLNLLLKLLKNNDIKQLKTTTNKKTLNKKGL